MGQEAQESRFNLIPQVDRKITGLRLVRALNNKGIVIGKLLHIRLVGLEETYARLVLRDLQMQAHTDHIVDLRIPHLLNGTECYITVRRLNEKNASFIIEAPKQIEIIREELLNNKIT